MKLELQSASNFLVHLVRLGRRNLNDNQLEKFRHALVEVLRRRYRDHWFPEKPNKGSGYRCLRINGKIDSVVAQAADSCGLNPQLIHQAFPSELTMWIDPLEVSYRIGENGSICVLYEFKEGISEAWKPNNKLHQPNVTCTKNPSNKKNGSVALASTGNNVEKKNSRNSHNNHQSLSSSPISSPLKQNTLSNTLEIKEMDKMTKLCKDSLRKMDFLLDPRKSVSIEQIAAYVSS